IGTTTPVSLLHLSDGANAVFAKFTNTTTGTGVNQGFNIGVDAAGIAQLRNNFGTPINFYSSSSAFSRRVTILGNSAGDNVGFVGIGLTNAPLKDPDFQLDVNRNININTAADLTQYF